MIDDYHYLCYESSCVMKNIFMYGFIGGKDYHHG